MTVWKTALVFVVSVLGVSGQRNSKECSAPSTLTTGPDVNTAIAYDAACNARNFRVTIIKAERILNLSSLQIANVKSYPSVYSLILSNNNLQTFHPEEEDTTTKRLVADQNAISDLTSLLLPAKLDYLNLAENHIDTIPSDAAWPSANYLQTLVLDSNSVADLSSDAFQPLERLELLSLANIGISNMESVSFPSSLQTLNVSSNRLSGMTNYTNLPSGLQTLDLSGNCLSTLPTSLGSLQQLHTLNLHGNCIMSLTDRRFPSFLRSLDLEGNPLTKLEIAQSDVSMFKSLQTFKMPSNFTQTCDSEHAERTTVQGIELCVIPDKFWGKTSEESSDGSDTSQSASGQVDDVVTEASTWSSTTLAIIGIACVAIALVLLIVAFLVFRRRRHAKPRETKGSQECLSIEHDTTPYEPEYLRDPNSSITTGGNWVFETPKGDHNKMSNGSHGVAILEDEDTKRKRSELDDLLDYEIPMDEVLIQEELGTNYSRKSPQTLRGMNASTAAASPTEKTPLPVMKYLAEFQGAQVVVCALSRSEARKKKLEKEFLDQVRLAASLEHSRLVQFLGVTVGNNSDQQAMTLEWQLAAIFEHMSGGTLSALFATHRSRSRSRRNSSRSQLAPVNRTSQPSVDRRSSTTYAVDSFTWYPPVFRGSMTTTNWRCKLSIALDVAMALVYLHNSNLIHGNLCAGNVMLDESGMAKLAALDVLRPSKDGKNSRLSELHSLRATAKAKMKQMVRFTSSSLSTSQMPGTNYDTGEHSISMEEQSQSHASERGGALYQEQKEDIYAFGVLLWELDTMVSIDSMKDLVRAAANAGEEHHMLKFMSDCPPEVLLLARRCWEPNPEERPDALDLQEELLQLLEGHLSTESVGNRFDQSAVSNSTTTSSAQSSEPRASDVSFASDIIGSEHETEI